MNQSLALVVKPFSRALIAKIYCFTPIITGTLKSIYLFSRYTERFISIGILRINLYCRSGIINYSLIIACLVFL